MTSHKWRKLVSSGRLVCRCSVVFLWRYVCFGFVSFAFTEAAALRSIVLRYVRAPTAKHSYLTIVCVLFRFRFFLFLLEMLLFPGIFGSLPFSLCMESTSYVFPFRGWFFSTLFVTTGWIFDINFCGNSINDSIKLFELCGFCFFLFGHNPEDQGQNLLIYCF